MIRPFISDCSFIITFGIKYEMRDAVIIWLFRFFYHRSILTKLPLEKLFNHKVLCICPFLIHSFVLIPFEINSLTKRDRLHILIKEKTKKFLNKINNQLKCGIIENKMWMRAGHDERTITYEWPKRLPLYSTLFSLVTVLQYDKYIL